MATGYYQPKMTRTKLWTLYRDKHGRIRPVAELTPKQQWSHWKRSGLILDPALTREKANELFRDNMGLAFKMAWRFAANPGKEFHGKQDELLSPAQHGLWCGILRFDPARGFKISTFLSRYIIGYIQTYMYEMTGKQTLKRHIKLIPFTDCPIVSRDGEEGGFVAVDNSEPIDLDTDYNQKLLNRLMGILSERDRLILQQRHWQGCTLEEIAEQHGISKERARQILLQSVYRMRRFARDAGFEWEGLEPTCERPTAVSFQRPRRAKAGAG